MILNLDNDVEHMDQIGKRFHVEVILLNTPIKYSKDGIEQCIEQGSEDKTKEVVINMLREKSDYEFISKITGKTIDEIKEIECKMKI